MLTPEEQALLLVCAEDGARGFEAGLYYEGSALSGKTHTIGGYTTTHGEMAAIVKRVVPEAEITVLPGDGGEPLTLPQDNTPSARRPASGSGAVWRTGCGRRSSSSGGRRSDRESGHPRGILRAST